MSNSFDGSFLRTNHAFMKGFTFIMCVSFVVFESIKNDETCWSFIFHDTSLKINTDLVKSDSVYLIGPVHSCV